MWLQHLYECVTCVMREDPDTCLFVLPYSRLQSLMEVSTKVFYKHSKQSRYVSKLRLSTFLSAVLSPFFATGNMFPLSFANHEELISIELKLVSSCVILPFIFFVRALVINILFNMSGLTPFEETADSGLTSFSHTSASCAEVC